MASDTYDNGLTERHSKNGGIKMTKKNLLPCNLQFFAEPGGTEPQNPPAASGGDNSTVTNVDYDKIQKMLEGTLKAKEDTALKAYFKQQGLSQDEAEQAMTAFKQKKAENTPDVDALNAQLQNTNAALQKAQIENIATMTGLSLGIDVNTLPYVIKMADLSQVLDGEGKIKEEAVKNALNKVLEDIPALKQQNEKKETGFTQVGVGGNSDFKNDQTAQTQVPTKRWNRWN